MEQLKPVSKLDIVNKVAAMLNIGDYGKVENFINKTISTLKREIEIAQRSKKNEEHNLECKLAELKEKYEDALANVEESYVNLDPKNLSTNEAQRSFMETYLTRIDQAESKAEGILKLIEEETEKSAKSIEELNAEIDVREKRITRLSKGNK